MGLWIWFAAPLIGVMLGLFGAGGGMLTVPLLHYGAELPLKQSIAMSIWIVAAVSLTAAVHQRVWRVVRFDLLAFFGIGGILGAIAGARIGLWVPAWVQQLLFSLLLFAVAWWMLKIRLEHIRQPDVPCKCARALLLGLGLGVLTGVLGVGGGFIMVPTLIALGISHLPTAVAHSLVLITLNAFASGISYLDKVPLEFDLLVGVAVLAGAGSLAGGFLLRQLPVANIQRGLSLLLIVIGSGMLGDLLLSLA